MPTIKSSSPRIEFEPQNENQKVYLAKLQGLLHQKRYGDWILVGQKLGITTKAAEQSFRRVFSRHHKMAVTALEELINERLTIQ